MYRLLSPTFLLDRLHPFSIFFYCAPLFVRTQIRGSDLGIGKGIREDLKIFDGA